MALKHPHVTRASALRLCGGVSLLVLATLSQAAWAQDTRAPEAETSTTGNATAVPGTEAQVLTGPAQPAVQTTNTDNSVDPDEATADDVVVTGIRASLSKAQDIKRQSDTVVDAITAEDIGALPDRSVNEALQRIPGVAITRYASPGDSQHFSVEGSGVVIRGLNYVKGEFNGRDTFAPNGGREIGYNDVAPELVGSVEVFKNLTPDLIEGGISGTVSINTRKPFDSSKRLVYLSGEVNIGDLAERSAPTVTGLYSDQWTLGSGARVGLLVSGTYSKLYSKSDSAFVASPFERFNAPDNGNDLNGDGNNCDPGEGRVFNQGSPYQSRVCDSFPVPAGLTSVYAPTGAGVRTQDFDRERYGISAAAQFATADDRLIATAAFLRTSGRNSWTEHTIEPNVWYPDVNATFPAPGTSYAFDKNGVFVSGQITRPGGFHGGWVNGTYLNELPNFQEGGLFTTQSNRGFLTNSRTDDYSLNLKFKANDRLRFNVDGQYVRARAKNIDQIIDTATFSNIGLDVSGNIPQVTFNFNRLPSGVVPTTQDYFANPNSLYFRDAFTNRDDNDGEEWATRFDAEYDVSEDSFLRRVRVGGRYSDRDQTVRTNNYNNWGAPSETWTSPGGAQTYATLDPSTYELFQFEDFFRGAAPMPPGASFLRGNIAENYDQTQTLLRQITARGNGNYTPIEDRACATVATYFCENEVYVNSERTFAGFARADFAADLGTEALLDGNVGVRYVNTLDRSFGSLTAPQRNSVLPSTFPDVATYCAAPRDPAAQIPPICRLSPAEQQAALAFSNGASTPIVARNKFDHWLPMLNVRLKVNPELQFRFAASRALSRPDFGQLRAYIGVNASVNQANDLIFTAGGPNPYLRPVEADQFDLTGEWYFSRVGSLTAALFYKRLSNVIDGNGQGIIQVTNNGQTRDAVLSGPVNLDGHANIKGAELAYQQTFDFLPGPLSGFGVQASYTYIDAGTIPTTSPSNGTGDGARPPGEVNDLYSLLPLPQLSKHNANAALFYEKSGFQARAAYSWRSRYLLSTRDCCFPFLPVFSEATGQLDGSIGYQVNSVFRLQFYASNLLNEVTRTSFALYNKGDEIIRSKRAAFINDRRYALAVKLTF